MSHEGRRSNASARLALVPVLRTRTLLVIAFLLAAASLLAEITEHVLGHEYLLGFVPLAKMDKEVSLPTWFSSVLLLCCAGFALLIGSMKRQERDPYRWYWLGLAAAFLLMSIDETAAIHEKGNALFTDRVDTGGVFFHRWVIAGAALTIAFVIVLRRFVRSLPATTRRQLVAAFALYFGAAVGLEMVEGAYSDARGGGEDLGGGMLATVEDVMEMCGAIAALAALAAYIRSQYPGLRLRPADGVLESASPRQGRRASPSATRAVGPVDTHR